MAYLHAIPLWGFFSNKSAPNSDALLALAENIRSAQAAEHRVIDCLKEYLSA